MSWDEVKDEKEGYVRVRKSDDRALIGRLKKENDDPEAKGYIELNKEDLGGMSGGGSGPHSHSEYSPKTHAHDDKADVNHTHDTTHTHNEFAASGHAHPDPDLTHDHAGEYQPVGNYADASHTHDGLGGESYDDSWIQPALDGKSDDPHTHPADPRLDALEQSQDEQDARLDALEADDCGSIMGHFVNGWNYYEDGGAEARDFNIKLHKPSSSKGGEHGDMDDRDVWETTGSLQQGDIVYFKVGDEVYEREYSRRSELQHYYDLVFTEKVDFVPKDTEFFIMDNPECVEEIPEHEHEGMVVSDSVTTIVRLTEAEYEALADKDPSTLYLVV